MQATSAAPQWVGPYSGRKPANSPPYRIIDTHYEAVLAQAEQNGAGYPAFVRNEFERYLSCGRLERG